MCELMAFSTQAESQRCMLHSQAQDSLPLMQHGCCCWPAYDLCHRASYCRGKMIAKDIARGLAYLHTNNIMHLDIKWVPSALMACLMQHLCTRAC